MLVRIVGRDLPGRECHPVGTPGYGGVHVGVQRRGEVVELWPGDAPGVHWEFDVDVVTRDDGTTDVRGPFVQGRPGARFLYLSWGIFDDAGAFTMFRRAKLMLDAAPIPAAADGVLVGTLGLTLPDGTPVCAAVRPPAINWAVRPDAELAGSACPGSVDRARAGVVHDRGLDPLHADALGTALASVCHR